MSFLFFFFLFKASTANPGSMIRSSILMSLYKNLLITDLLTTDLLIEVITTQRTKREHKIDREILQLVHIPPGFNQPIGTDPPRCPQRGWGRPGLGAVSQRQVCNWITSCNCKAVSPLGTARGSSLCLRALRSHRSLPNEHTTWDALSTLSWAAEGAAPFFSAPAFRCFHLSRGMNYQHPPLFSLCPQHKRTPGLIFS